MSHAVDNDAPRGRFAGGKRMPVALSSRELIKTGFLDSAGDFPLVIEPAFANVNLVDWARSNRALIESMLLEHGAILFRGFNVNSIGHSAGHSSERPLGRFEEVARAITPDLLDYSERAAPRAEVGKNIYTSTEFPADQHIPLHHEMSYSHNWPTKIWFYCAQPASRQGATPIADDRKVFKRIDPSIKKLFTEKRVMYVRNYGDGLDLTWQDVFQTSEREKVEEYCRRSHCEFEWKPGNRLRTRQVRQAVAVHPKLGETVWFNHAHMFHISNLEPHVRESLVEAFGEDVPRNAYYGDGSSIETSVLDEIRGIYNEEAVIFTWQEGDIMLLDNFLASHGRQPFIGPRKIVVAMAEMYTSIGQQI